VFSVRYELNCVLFISKVVPVYALDIGGGGGGRGSFPFF